MSFTILKSQNELVKFYDTNYVLVSKKYFVELHQKSTKFDSLKVLFSSQERLLNEFKNNYDSLKSTFNLKINIEKEKSHYFNDINEKLITRNKLLIQENDEIILTLDKEKRKNRAMKKITLFSSCATIILFILK